MPVVEVVVDYKTFTSFKEVPIRHNNTGSHYIVDEPKKGFAKFSTMVPLDGSGHLLDVSELKRCVGLIFLYKPRSDNSDEISYLQGFHIPPTQKITNGMWREFVECFSELKATHYVARIIMAGGRICSPVNEWHYKNSCRFFFERLQHHSSTSSAQFLQFRPRTNTYSTMLMAFGHQLVVYQQLYDATTEFSLVSI